MKCCDKTEFTTLTLPLATETRTSLTFKMGEREAVKFATRFMSVRLVKQEDFCGAIALTIEISMHSLTLLKIA